MREFFSQRDAENGQLEPALDPTATLFLRRMDRIIEKQEILEKKYRLTRKTILIFGASSAALLTGLLAMTLPVAEMTENSRLLIQAGALAAEISGVTGLVATTIKSIFSERPNPFLTLTELGPKPNNYPEGFDVSERIKASLSDVNLDPTHYEIPPTISRGLTDINLDLD